MTPQVLTGARAIVSISGTALAWCSAVSYTIETAHEEVMTIDRSVAAELSPTRIRVSGSLKVLRVARQTSASLIGVQPTMNSLLTEPYLSLQILDRKNDDTILFIPRVKFNRRAGQIDARSLASEQWDFIGIGFWDEMAPKQ